MAIEPDPRTAPDEVIEDGALDDVDNDGVSNTDPAEGDDDAAGRHDGSPG